MFWIISAKRWKVLTGWWHKKWGGRVCQGEIWNIQLAQVEVRVPLNGTAMKRTGENSRFGTACQREEGWVRGGGLKLEPSPCSIKTPQRDLCRQRRPVERIPLKPINRQRTRGFHRGALPPPPNNSAEDTRAAEPASGSGWNVRECWNEQETNIRSETDFNWCWFCHQRASSRKKKRYSRVCQETVQW